MKLSWSPQGANAWEVFGNTDSGDFVSGFQPRMQAIAQVTPLFRAKNQFVSARDNRVWSLEGVVESVFGSADAALSYIQARIAEMLDSVDIKIEEGNTILYLTNAALVGYEPLVKGCSTTIKYSFVGSDLTQPAPSGS